MDHDLYGLQMLDN